MAKSAGNIERIAELADRKIDPLAFRYLCLTSRYRHKLEYTVASLAAAAAGLDSLRAGLRGLGPPAAGGPWRAPLAIRAGRAPDRPVGTATSVAGHGGAIDGTTPTDESATSGGRLPDRAASPAAPLSVAGRDLHDRFVAAVDDDLDLPTALAVTRELLRAPLSEDERRWLILDADAVLGLDLDHVWDSSRSAVAPDDVQVLLADRAAARAAGDYGRADSIRASLAARGWEIVDEPGGSRLRPVSRG
jgi:cysteinyl-tRNA synthetase